MSPNGPSSFFNIFIHFTMYFGNSTPYLDFRLGLGRRVGRNNGNGRLGTDQRTELSLTRRSPKFSSLSREANEEDKILDVVLLATIDGKFHALNRTDGTILWSMQNSFTTDCAVGEQEKSLSPLIRTANVLQPPESDENGDDEEKIYIVEPQSGSIYILSPAQAMIR